MANIPTPGDFEYGPKRWILQMLAVKVSTDISQPRDMFGGSGSSTSRIDPLLWFGLVYGDEIDSIDPKDSADAGDEHPKFQAIWVRKPAKTWGSILGFACRRTPEAVTEPQACCAALARLQQLGIATEVDIDPWKTSTPVPSNMPGWGIPQLNGHVPSGKLT